MNRAFPNTFRPAESGGGLVQFVDVPEACTSGVNEAVAAKQALDSTA